MRSPEEVVESLSKLDPGAGELESSGEDVVWCLPLSPFTNTGS